MCSGGAFIDTGFQAGATRAPRRKPFKRLSHRVACSVLSASMSGVKSAGDSGRYNTNLRGLAPKERRSLVGRQLKDGDLEDGPSLSPQRLIEVLDQVVGVFEADGHAQQAFGRSCTRAFDGRA